MTNSSNQFIAFEINGGAEEIEISGNTIAGPINSVLKSDQKIGKFKATNNTILNTTEIEVLNNIISTINKENNLPDEIKFDLSKIIKDLQKINTSNEKESLFKKLATINEKIINLGASSATIVSFIQTLIS